MKQPVESKMKDDEVDPFFMINAQSQQIKEELDAMLSNSTITESEYNKEITLLAYEFALQGFADDCVLMLMNTKSDYFKNAAIEHFRQDETFLSKCVLIFEVLSYIGYVPFDVMATQKAANA